MTTEHTRDLTRYRDHLYAIAADLRNYTTPGLPIRAEICPHIYYAAQLIHEHLIRTRPGARTGLARPLVHPPPTRNLNTER